MKTDYEYLCENLGRLTGLTVRVYRKGEQICFFSNKTFLPDFVTSIQSKVLSEEYSASYYDIANILFIGAITVKKDDVSIVIGPTSNVHPEHKQIIALLRELGESHSRQQELTEYLHDLPCYPLENFLNILCFVSYSLNGIKLRVRDLIAQETSFINMSPAKGQQTSKSETYETAVHNTLEMEKELLFYIENGRIDMLEKIFDKPPSGRAGKMAGDALRQIKNTFICSATLASRAAIKGGASQEIIFSISDFYIQKVEALNDANKISCLSVDMLFEFAEQVRRLNYKSGSSKKIVDISRYILENIDKKLNACEIASYFEVSCSYLCAKFKKEMGITLSEYITQQKLVEAKRLLLASDQGIVHIGEFLSFSSQGYFQNVFKKYVGCTPGQYRKTSGNANS